MDVSWVTTRIATGSAVPPGEIASLRHEGITSMTDTGITTVFDTRAEVNDAALYVSAGVGYIWLPTVDDGLPKREEYWGALLREVLPYCIMPWQRLLFQCGAGVNRGPSAAFCTMIGLGWLPEVAEARIRAVRPQVGLSYRDDVVRSCEVLGYL